MFGVIQTTRHPECLFGRILTTESLTSGDLSSSLFLRRDATLGLAHLEAVEPVDPGALLVFGFEGSHCVCCPSAVGAQGAVELTCAVLGFQRFGVRALGQVEERSTVI